MENLYDVILVTFWWCNYDDVAEIAP